VDHAIEVLRQIDEVGRECGRLFERVDKLRVAARRQVVDMHRQIDELRPRLQELHRAVIEVEIEAAYKISKATARTEETIREAEWAAEEAIIACVEETIREAERAAEEAVIAADIKLSTAMSYEDIIFQTRAECRAMNEALMADEEDNGIDWNDDDNDSDGGDDEE
jgi:hypothetical protein